MRPIILQVLFCLAAGFLLSCYADPLHIRQKTSNNPSEVSGQTGRRFRVTRTDKEIRRLISRREPAAGHRESAVDQEEELRAGEQRNRQRRQVSVQA